MLGSIKQAIAAYNAHIEKRLAEIPAGDFLCVHHKVEPTADDFKVLIEIESHILKDDEICSKKNRLGLYGPQIKEPADG